MNTNQRIHWTDFNTLTSIPRLHARSSTPRVRQMKYRHNSVECCKVFGLHRLSYTKQILIESRYFGSNKNCCLKVSFASDIVLHIWEPCIKTSTKSSEINFVHRYSGKEVYLINVIRHAKHSNKNTCRIR